MISNRNRKVPRSQWGLALSALFVTITSLRTSAQQIAKTASFNRCQSAIHTATKSPPSSLWEDYLVYDDLESSTTHNKFFRVQVRRDRLDSLAQGTSDPNSICVNIQIGARKTDVYFARTSDSEYLTISRVEPAVPGRCLPQGSGAFIRTAKESVLATNIESRVAIEELTKATANLANSALSHGGKDQNIVSARTAFDLLHNCRPFLDETTDRKLESLVLQSSMRPMCESSGVCAINAAADVGDSPKPR